MYLIKRNVWRGKKQIQSNVCRTVYVTACILRNAKQALCLSPAGAQPRVAILVSVFNIRILVDPPVNIYKGLQMLTHLYQQLVLRMKRACKAGIIILDLFEICGNHFVVCHSPYSSNRIKFFG